MNNRHPSATRIKICGLTRAEDICSLAGFGIDFVGFVFVPASPRFLSRAKAVGLASLVKDGIKKIGVFANQDQSLVSSLSRDVGLDFLQFHGEETPEFCRSFGLPFFKAFPVLGTVAWEKAAAYRPGKILLDSSSRSKRGGTGIAFDWSLALGDRRGMDLILAGGLNPENVGEAIRRVRPWGVDVSSGVELAPGVKEIEKIRRFVEAVKAADEEIFTRPPHK